MRWVSAGGMMPPEVWRRRAARRPPGRGAFAQRLAAAFPLPPAVRRKNSVPSICCSRFWGSIDGAIGYWVRCRASAPNLRCR